MSLLNRHRTLAEQLSGAFLLLAALVAAAFVVTALAYGVGWAWLTPELERSRQAEKAEAASSAAMFDEDNAVRDYLATQDPRSRQAYERAEVRLARANESLTANAGAVPTLATAMVDTRLAEERWRADWAKPAARARSTDELPPTTRGKPLFLAYRIQQTAFAEALALHTDMLSHREQRLVAGRVIVELVVFAAVLLLVMRQHHALRNAIVTPVAALLHHIRRIRDGQFEATVDRTAPRELAELAEGLNEVVRALVSARESAALRDEALSEHSIRLHRILDASREFSESLNLAYVMGSVRRPRPPSAATKKWWFGSWTTNNGVSSTARSAPPNQARLPTQRWKWGRGSPDVLPSLDAPCSRAPQVKSDSGATTTRKFAPSRSRSSSVRGSWACSRRAIRKREW